MRTTRSRLAALAAAAALATTLAACGGGGGSGGYGGGASTPTDTMSGSSSGGGSGSAGALSTADSDLGTIVVDGQGMTVYYYTPDEAGSGKSECTGECLAAWPPVHAGSATPEVQGVTAEVGTITGNDGESQVTLDGRPVYLYAGDAAPGDVAGQGIQDVWWVVAPDGSEITTMPGSGGGGY
ncbi:COG4315 family predicted lipoprotein [Isoptericola nanjingensis]|uniref:COG4315 family predicted lipoprotein n=1 Tax=Isoptericola TaxID=254250 RepID=UPI0037AAE145